MKLSADGRTMLRGSYGRFSQGVLSGELSPFHPGAKPATTAAFVPATGGYTSIVSVVDPRRNLRLDGDVRAPRTDEYSIGVDREIGRRLAAAIAYVRKDGSNFIGWTDVGGQYREEARTLPDGQTVPVFVLANETTARRFLLTNPQGYSMTYNGVVMAVEKRRSHGWRAFGSYTWSEASGLQASSGAVASGSQISTIAGTPSARSGRIRTRLPTRAAACQMIVHTCFMSWAASTSLARASWSRPISSTSAASRGRPRRRLRCRRAISAFYSSRAARVGCQRSRFSMCACRGQSPLGALGRAASGRIQCAQRQSGGRLGIRQSVQPKFRPALSVYRSAPRDARREAEPGSVIVGSTCGDDLALAEACSKARPSKWALRLGGRGSNSG